MRAAFIETLSRLARADDRIWLITGDLGFSVLEPFAGEFPDQFVNAGVAEQNMTGVAAGIAMCGKVVFTYSIANFPTLRCLEQIRNDACYHNLNVKIVAVGGGLTYGAHGYTHHAVEDLGIMRLLPNMMVLAPADPVETRLATAEAVRHQGPCYLRLGKARESVLHASEPAWRTGQPIVVQEGEDIAILSSGGTLKIAIDAAARLVDEGIHAGVISVPFLNPVDRESFESLLTSYHAIVTVEEHGPGGLGTLAAELAADCPRAARISPVRLGSSPQLVAWGHEQLRDRAGVSVDAVIARCRNLAAITTHR